MKKYRQPKGKVKEKGKAGRSRRRQNPAKYARPPTATPMTQRPMRTGWAVGTAMPDSLRAVVRRGEFMMKTALSVRIVFQKKTHTHTVPKEFSS